jgi:hypothetical protein
MIVRCIDNTLQADVLVEGREYEILAERDDCYILSGFDNGFSKTRFEIVSQPTTEFIPIKIVVTPTEPACRSPS